MKTKKTKSKNKTKVSAKGKTRAKNYPAHILAITLAVMVLLEGILIGGTTKVHWEGAADLLDVSAAIEQTVADTAEVFSPVADTIASVNKFYMLATNEMMALLDLTETFRDVSHIWDGVNEFYAQASTQLAGLFDFSTTQKWPAAVAGVSVER